MQQNFKAFIFDLNGTMIDDMSFHEKAWHYLLTNDLGKEITPEEVKLQMYGKNEEVLDRIFGSGKFTRDEYAKLSLEKERRYQQAYLPSLKLIDGLELLLANAYKAGIPMAIGSAAIPFNIDFVLDNLHLHHYFSAIVSASDVTKSKPDPETFAKAAILLSVPPHQCVVFEDAPKGVEAALNAGMKAIVLTTMHTKEEFAQYNNVIGFIQDYTDPQLKNWL